MAAWSISHFHAILCSALPPRLTPSITPAGLAPTRARDGQTIFILGTLKAFQNFHAMAVLKPIILRKKEGFSVQTESVLVQRWKSGRRCRHVCAIFFSAGANFQAQSSENYA